MVPWVSLREAAVLRSRSTATSRPRIRATDREAFWRVLAYQRADYRRQELLVGAEDGVKRPPLDLRFGFSLVTPSESGVY